MGFKALKCKTLLKLAMSRIKLLRNKRDIQVKQMRRDIAQLLGTGQEPSARIRVEHVIREQNILDAYDMVELYAELIVVRLPIINGQKTCPADLKEAVSSLIFAAPRCADLPELAEIKSCFVLKYGKEFVATAAELRPSCGVNRRLIEKMSVRAPTGENKLKVLKQIAAEYGISWDPANAEAELLAQPEDLLDGPQKFVAASSMPATTFKSEESAPKNKSIPPAQAPTVPKPAPTRHSSFSDSNRAETRAPTSPVVLGNVAAAALAAAESAEHAAAAARAVASLAKREVLQGISDQAMNSTDYVARYKLKDYLSGNVGDEDDNRSDSEDYDNLTARFQALKARRYS